MEPSPAHCSLIVPLLQARDGIETVVHLSAAATITVLNIAWGDDIGDPYEHITSNISPSLDGLDIDLFFTDEVRLIVDPASGTVLWTTDGEPNVR